MSLMSICLSLALVPWGCGAAAAEVSCPADESIPDAGQRGGSLLHVAPRRAADRDGASTGASRGDASAESALRALQVSAGGRRLELKHLYPWYHTTDELSAQARLLAAGCGGALSLETVRENSVDIEVATVRRPGSRPQNRMFVLFGEHSRELISTESGLYFLRVLCGTADADSAQGAGAMLEDSEFQLVLNGNPRSRRMVESGDWCKRTNPNGVDLNRNWDEEWRPPSAGNPDTNPGPEPFSEPETRIFRRLVTAYRPTAFLSVHSGTRTLFMPWAFDKAHLATRNRASILHILRVLAKDHCQCPYGAAGKEVGYSSPGTSLDWVYDKLKTPYAFAVEIYGPQEEEESLSARWQEKLKSGGESLLERGEHLGHELFLDLFQRHTSDFVSTLASSKALLWESCFSMFNPDTKETFDATLRNWAGVYLDMANLIVADMRKWAASAAAANATHGPLIF